jgi:hypothetical protein
VKRKTPFRQRLEQGNPGAPVAHRIYDVRNTARLATDKRTRPLSPVNWEMTRWDRMVNLIWVRAQHDSSGWTW